MLQDLKKELQLVKASDQDRRININDALLNDIKDKENDVNKIRKPRE